MRQFALIFTTLAMGYLAAGPFPGNLSRAIAATAAPSCGIPAIQVPSASVPAGSFDPGTTSLSSCISARSRGLSSAPSSSGVYDVRRFGAKCDDRTDDTSAIQRAERAAAEAGGGTVYVPRGRCVISTGIAWDSNVDLYGAGMFATTLVASADFGFDPTKVRRGPDGRWVGMLWLDGPTRSEPLRNVTISDIGFDPRRGTQGKGEGKTYGLFKYEPITSYMRALQHVTFNDLYFNLGYNSSNYIGVSDGPKGFTGFTLMAATDCDNPSFDLSFNNIVAHNGDGTIQLYASDPPSRRCTGRTSISNVRINGVADFIDGRFIDDDRIVLGGSAIAESEIRDAVIDNVQTYVFDGVTGGINAIKLQPGVHGDIHGVQIANLRYRGSGDGRYGSPLRPYDANGSGAPIAVIGTSRSAGVDDVSISNIWAANSMGMPLAIKASPLAGGIAKLDVQNVTLLHCYSTGAAFMPAFFSDPTGQDDVRISGITLESAPEALARGKPIGLMVRGYRGANGAVGTFVISNVSVRGYPIPVYVAAGSSFRDLTLQNVHWDGGTVRLPPSVRVTP